MQNENIVWLTEFRHSDLYYGTNSIPQDVFTWVAQGTPTSFTGDVAPLITRLQKLETGPKASHYLGYYAFGTEAYYAKGNMTFSNQKLELSVNGQ